jgi:hypothetical protein
MLPCSVRSIRALPFTEVKDQAIAAKSFIKTGSDWSIERSPDREMNQRLLVTEIVSPRAAPDNANAQRRGSALSPHSRAKLVSAPEIVDCVAPS